MRPYTTLLVIFCFTLATVGSDGQLRRNTINTLHTTISINDINNIATSSNYTKRLFNNNNNNNSNANANSFNATIVLPVTASSSSSSSPTPSSSSSSYVLPSSILNEAATSFSSTTLTPVPVILRAGASGAGLSTATEASVFRDKRGASLDPAEIARQNQITQQILSNYLERRLFPERSVSQKIPTIEDILPKPILSTTTTKTPKQRARPRGFATSSSSFRNGSARRKTYGQRNTPNSLQHVLKSNKSRSPEEEQANEEELQEEPELENVKAEAEDNSQNKTLSYDNDEDEEEEEMKDEEQDEYYKPPRHPLRYTQRYRHAHQHSRRPSSYHHRYYDDDIEQDGQESLQSVESEQHDRYYKSKGDIFSRDPSENEIDSDCPHCVDETQYMNKWTMPLLKLGEKRYYLGIFFKANWFKATQYCRYHGMHLASISSQEENDKLEKHIKDFGLGHEHFWISGTDLADEGNFFWMATGRPITFTNWNAGEPNNFRYENGEEENCMELWNRDGKGLKWNDSPCSFETYFVCEVQP